MTLARNDPRHGALFDEVREKLSPLYICEHTHGLMSAQPCKKGCKRQAAMFREDELRRALALPSKRLRSEPDKGESTVYGIPAGTVLDLIYEARRAGRLR